MVMGSERRFSNQPNLGGKCNYDTIGMMHWKIVLSGKQMPNLYMHMNTWVRMAYHRLHAKMTKYFRPLDCGFELKDFHTFKTCSKKERGLLPNGKLMDFFKVEINFFLMEKGCTLL
jgi:hypothetical protein